MDPSLKSPWWKGRRWKVLIAAIILLATYCGTFFVLRQDMSVTFLVRDRFYAVRVFYFSKNRSLNYAAWLLFYPLHRQSGASLNRLDAAFFAKEGKEEMARLKLHTFYVADVDMLYRAQVIGFHSKSDGKLETTTATESGSVAGPTGTTTESQSKPDSTEKKAEPNTPSVFPDSPTELTLYSLDFRDEKSPSEPKTDGKKRFRNYLVIGKTEIKDSTERESIMASINQAVREPPDFGAACFDPRHGLKIVAANGTTEVVICFACSQYSSTGAHRSDGFPLISAKPENMLNGILKEAKIEVLPGMEELMRQRRERKQL